MKTKDILTRKNCILCHSRDLKNAINFGKTPLANSYPKISNKKEEFYRLAIMLCNQCGHLQLKDIVSPKKMFDNYLYVTGTSPILRKHFYEYAKKFMKNGATILGGCCEIRPSYIKKITQLLN